MAQLPTVLLIDDRPDAATVLSALLVEAGAQVRGLHDAPALAAAAAAPGDVVAVIVRANLAWCPAAELAGMRARAFPNARLMLLGLPEDASTLLNLGRAGIDEVVAADATGLVTLARAIADALPTSAAAQPATRASGPAGLTSAELDAAKRALFGGAAGGADAPVATASDEPDRETLAMLAHDLREPVRAVRTWLTLLRGRHGEHLPDDASALVQQATDATERLRGRLDALIDEARDRPTMTLDAAAWCDAEAVLEDVLADLAPLVDDASARIRYAPLPELPMRADHLQRVLQNLIANAIRHRGDAVPVVDVEVTDRGDDWLVQVRDNGPGIAEQDQQRVFEAFEGGERGGSGLGLSACQRIVTRYGGRIWVQSNVEAARETGRTGGPGAAILFTLPRRRMSEVG